MSSSRKLLHQKSSPKEAIAILTLLPAFLHYAQPRLCPHCSAAPQGQPSINVSAPNSRALQGKPARHLELLYFRNRLLKRSLAFATTSAISVSLA